jgi:hypothetical protein
MDRIGCLMLLLRRCGGATVGTDMLCERSVEQTK